MNVFHLLQLNACKRVLVLYLSTHIKGNYKGHISRSERRVVVKFLSKPQSPRQTKHFFSFLDLFVDTFVYCDHRTQHNTNTACVCSIYVLVLKLIINLPLGKIKSHPKVLNRSGLIYGFAVIFLSLSKLAVPILNKDGVHIGSIGTLFLLLKLELFIIVSLNCHTSLGRERAWKSLVLWTSIM